MLPKEIKSLWAATVPETKYPKLESRTAVDAAIIGAGIAGLNAGYFLLHDGLKVAVIDSRHVTAGTSGNTTAKITSQHFLKFAYLKDKFGLEKAKIYADSNEWAIKEAERIIEEENIDCDFIRLPAHVYSQTEEGLEEIEKEVAAAQELGLPASFVDHIDDVGFKITGAIRFDNQAYFHPRKYLLALAEIIRKKGGIVFEETEALDIIERENCLVVTPTCNISARYVIIATNYPFKNISDISKPLHTSASYVLAARPGQPIPEGMFIALDGNRLSFRPHRSGKDEWLLIGGESYDAEQEENVDHFTRLEKTASENFRIKQIDFRWAAEDTMTEDKVPMIGKIPATKNLFVTTGYNKWGMTLSFVSAKILADLIAGRNNKWADFYSPARLLENIPSQPGPAARKPSPAITAETGTQDLDPKTGKVISYNNKKIAVYKDAGGKLHARSPICTHLGCTVGWNNKDKTWDCPCHGSRFDKDGQVIHGPAERPLPKVEVGND